jgi:hypothetical protein
MPTILEELGFRKLLADFQLEKNEPNLDHYPKNGDFHCRGCYHVSSHFFIGMESIKKRRPRLIPRPRKVAYMCRNCKFLAEFKFCPKGETLKFEEFRS